MTLDLSHLSGPDALVALRSYPRRFRSAAIPVEDDPEVEEWAERIGPEGRSVIDVLVHTTGSWVLVGRALHQLLFDEGAVVHPAVTDADARGWETPPGTDLQAALAQLTDAVTAMAETVAAIHSPDWNRSAAVAGGGTTTALDLVREAVRIGAEGLHAVETTLAAVRP